MNRRSPSRAIVVLAAIVIAAGGAVWIARGGRPHPAVALTTQAVSRHDIALTVEASGTIEPVDLVEVKSKASGTITAMPVSVGSRVAAGALLVQIDTRDVRNQYDQSRAAQQAARVKVEVSEAQKARADSLFSQGVITAAEHEAAMLDDAASQASLITANTNLDLSQQRLDDATVRAPVAGTVLSQSVTEGQVISSATSSASGGTTLLTMANLGRIRMRALVAEADIGNVRPGQRATLTVDAFPNREFEGTVEKVEPQAMVEQSVTNFPVLVSLSNEDGLLLPGMNGDVTLVVDRRSDVLAVPVDAVRNQREALVLAVALGLDPDSVRAQLESHRGAGRAGDGDSLGAGSPAGGSDHGAWRDSLRARGGRHGGRWHGHGEGGMRGESGVRGEFGGGGWRGGTDGVAATGGENGGWSGGGGATGGPNRHQVVFVKTATGIEPRRVRLGLSDFDWSQVLSGVAEGEQVVMLGVAQAQANRAQDQAQLRERVGTMPGGAGAQGGGGRGRGGS